MTHRKKLIEVALPLDAINAAAAREKSIRHGHPSTLHLWWARRPLAAARAVIFAQMVDDPASSRPELFPTEQEQDRERQRLFDLIEALVRWENTTTRRCCGRRATRSARAGGAPAPTDCCCTPAPRSNGWPPACSPPPGGRCCEVRRGRARPRTPSLVFEQALQPALNTPAGVPGPPSSPSPRMTACRPFT